MTHGFSYNTSIIQLELSAFQSYNSQNPILPGEPMNTISNMRLELYSNNYYRCLNSFTQSEFETAKILGQFYTHICVAETMVENLLEQMDKSSDRISVIDPFCGDGRLIVTFIQKLSEVNPNCQIEVTIWDIDEKGLETAKQNILDAAKQFGMQIHLISEVTDSFARYYEKQYSFDVCITNPPWSILKPQKYFADQHEAKEQETFNQAIASYDAFMKEEFHISQPTAKFGKWGTNLARCGTEVALKLVKANGFCSIVSPASLLSDQVSERFRKWIFENYTLSHINYYVAGAKLYGSADITSVTLLFRHSFTEAEIQVFTYDDQLNSTKHTISSDEFNFIKRNGYVFPFETGIEIISTLSTFEKLPTLGDKKIGLKFCREIDETRIQERLLPEGETTFVKGYMIDRYTYSPAPEQYANPEKCVIPDSTNYERIAWRDVSRNSQLRRVKATIIPSHTIAGNSLGVAYLQSPDSSRLRYLLAIVNSIVFECQARSMLVTNHVSAGVMKKIHIPVPNEKIAEKIVPLVNHCLKGDLSAEPYIESLVAINYGLSLQDFLEISKPYYETEESFSTLQEIAKCVYDGEKL